VKIYPFAEIAKKEVVEIGAHSIKDIKVEKGLPWYEISMVDFNASGKD